MKKIFYFIGILLTFSCSGAPNQKSSSNANSISHELWNSLLKKHVSDNGNVNYKSFKADEANLVKYLRLLESAHPNDSWSDNERKAYWINVYNAFTVKLIVDNYPVKSIKDIGGVLKSPWDIKFIKIEGTEYTLSDIEHKILRKEFDDARIHFAINCASYSCPRLLNTAYVPEKLDEQLNEMAVSFINDLKRNIVGEEKVQLSEIFKWFKGDFIKKSSLVDYLNKYSKVKIQSDAKVSFIKYNWSLNE